MRRRDFALLSYGSRKGSGREVSSMCIRAFMVEAQAHAQEMFCFSGVQRLLQYG